MIKLLKYVMFALIISISSITNAVENQQFTQGPAQFVSKEGDYSIQIPDHWELMTNQMGTDLIALAPLLDAQDLFRENLNIISAKFEFPMSKEEYYALNMKSLNDLLTDFDLENSQDIQLGGVDAREITFTHRIGVVNVRVTQYLILVNQKAIVISFTSDTIEYPKMKDQFAQIASTFKMEKF